MTPLGSSLQVLLLVCWIWSVWPAPSATEQITSPNTFSWRDLTETELAEWYTPADLCVLNTSMKSSFPQDIRGKECAAFTRGSRRMFCGVGMGNNNYPCYGPFGDARPSFKRGVEGYTNASAKPLLEAANRLMDSNSVLLLLGDSTMRQKLQALQCEIAREVPNARFNGNLFGIVPCDTLLHVYFPGGRELQVYGISLGPRALECVAKHLPPREGGRPYSLKEVEAMFAEDPARGVTFNANKIVEYVNDVTNRSVTIIANTGLWYNKPDEYRQIMPGILDWLLRVQRRQHAHDPVQYKLSNRVAWHETLRQHWISLDGTGYFQVSVVDQQEAEWKTQGLEQDNVTLSEFMVPHCCHRITNASDWRNDIVHDLIRRNEQLKVSIPILPMADISRDIPDLHTCNPWYKHDCTHYCFTPLMYQPLWHQIASLTSSAKV